MVALPQSTRRPAGDFYRAVWRWHFYAGLIVLPFLMTLAITGALYLFRDELDGIIHADLKRVEAAETQALPASAWTQAALARYPGSVTKIVMPMDDRASAEIHIGDGVDAKTSVYVNPGNAEVLGALPVGGTVMGFVRQLHSLAFFGPIANAVVEIAAGWAILLVATGVYLWWPRRGSEGGVVTLRGRPRQRMWWRDVHAVTGAFAGVFIIFLALSGMPWSIFWGAQVGGLVDKAGLGVPPGVWGGVPTSKVPLSDLGHAAWTVERSNVPLSGAAQGQFGVDDAVAKFRDLGLARGFAVDLPQTPDGVFTGSVFPDTVEQQRVVHLDRYSGKPLIDVGYAQYGPVAKVMEWGISVHMGQQFGRANQLLMLAVCLSILALCVSAAVMWWKRRPAGALGIPPLPSDRRRLGIVAAILALGGALFPLTALSFLVLAAADWVVQRRVHT